MIILILMFIFTVIEDMFTRNKTLQQALLNPINIIFSIIFTVFFKVFHAGLILSMVATIIIVYIILVKWRRR